MDFKVFERDECSPGQDFTFIGKGELGGKAKGLALMKLMMEESFPCGDFDGIQVDIPRMTVIRTDIFERFMAENDLYEVALNSPDDAYIAHQFQKASLPAEIVGDLLNLITSIHLPLAIRSSALLEDSLHEPFAGVYESKMIPNRSSDATTRFNQLCEAIKFVYSTLYFYKAKQYFKAIRKEIKSEKMAVIIQEVVGDRFDDYFFPTVSGVIRSLNFYPTGNAKPENGVVQLALGMGKSIVDGGKTWCYSPRFPSSPPPYNSIGEMLENTQTRFWVINMGQVTEYDPTLETEYMLQLELEAAEKSGSMKHVASTLCSEDGTIQPGVAEKGPRLLNFAPILQCDTLPLNNLIKKILLKAEEKTGEKVEIEFAMRIPADSSEPPHFGFLQVRPLAISDQIISLQKKDFDKNGLLVLPDRVLGNGSNNDVCDVVYVKPESFDVSRSRDIAKEIEMVNEILLDEGRGYLLIGFGRWGTSDPWLGIPINWSQISGSKAIVEATFPQLSSDFSQGSHFFHNVFGSGVFYFSVTQGHEMKIDWSWLDCQQVISESAHIRHVRLVSPLKMLVDGRNGKGVIRT